MKNQILLPQITATRLTDSTTFFNTRSNNSETVTIVTDVVKVLFQINGETDPTALDTETDFQQFQLRIAKKIGQNQHQIQELRRTMNRICDEIRIDYQKRVAVLQQKNKNLKSKLAR